MKNQYNWINKLYTSLDTISVDEVFKYIWSIIWILPVVFIAQKIGKKIFNVIINRMLRKKENKLLRIVSEEKIFIYLSHYVPGFLLLICATFVEYQKARSFVHGLGVVYIGFVTITLLNAILNVVSAGLRNNPTFKQIPINSYIQVVKIVLFAFICLAVLLGVVLDEKTVIALLGGIGGFSAVTAFVFKDTLSSFIAGIVLTANDMINIGDWISVNSAGADGEVIDITLNTVKVRNWDNSVTTVPPIQLLNGSFSNWDMMQKSNARRIKRSININLKSIDFVNKELLDKLGQLEELATFIELYKKEDQQGKMLTNVALFRHYLENYLKNHKELRGDLTCMVRELQPTTQGLPIEAYAFTATSNWVAYEKIQADIIDHIYAILPYFDLEAYQQLSGLDFNN